MTITSARSICCLVLGSLLLIAVVVGSFVGVPWFALSLMAFLAMVLLGKRSALDSATSLVRELRGLWGSSSELSPERRLEVGSRATKAQKNASFGESILAAESAVGTSQERQS